MTTLVIMVVVAACYGCFYFGWKQGTRLGEKRALEKITYRATEAEKRTQEAIKHREAAEYQCANEKVRADAWEKAAKGDSLEEEKEAAEKRQQEWDEWLHKQQHSRLGLNAAYMQQLRGMAQQQYSPQGLFPMWWR